MKRFKRARRARGSAVIELAVALPLLTTLFLGCFQFGYAFYVYGQLHQAVRAGARYASIRTYDSGSATPSEAFLREVQNVVVYGDPNAGDQAAPIVRGLQTSNVQLDVTTGAAPVGAVPLRVAVSINGYQLGVFSPMVLNNKPRAEFPYVGFQAH